MVVLRMGWWIFYYHFHGWHFFGGCHPVVTETCKKYSITVIFYRIFHIKRHVFKTLLQGELLLDFDEIFTNKDMVKCSFQLWSQHNFIIRILRVYMLSTKLNSKRQEDNTMKVLLKTYNSSLCLNREYLKSMLSKNMLK